MRAFLLKMWICVDDGEGGAVWVPHLRWQSATAWQDDDTQNTVLMVDNHFAADGEFCRVLNSDPSVGAQLVLVPQNTTLQDGAVVLGISGQAPGGDPRGASAVDFQNSRNADTQVASGANSFIAGGANNTASGNYAHAEGYGSFATGDGSHAEGYSDSTATSKKATGQGAHVEGNDTNGGALLASGNGAHAEGDVTGANSTITASGLGSHAEGVSQAGSQITAGSSESSSSSSSESSQTGIDAATWGAGALSRPGGGAGRPAFPYRVTAVIPHRDTPDLLRLCIRFLERQTERPYVMVVDTGSRDELLHGVLALRGEGTEVHQLACPGPDQAVASVSYAMDLALAACRTEWLWCLHSDCFMINREALTVMLSRAEGGANPVVGYEMPPSHNGDRRGMVSHTCTLFHVPTMDGLNVTWSMRRFARQANGANGELAPSPETVINQRLNDAGVAPVLLGSERAEGVEIDAHRVHLRAATARRIGLAKNSEDNAAERTIVDWLERLSESNNGAVGAAVIPAGIVSEALRAAVVDSVQRPAAWTSAKGAARARPDQTDTICRERGQPILFKHGLGDAVTFAHSIPLYTARGHAIRIACAADKEILFRAAGAEIVDESEARLIHVYPYPQKIPQVMPHDWLPFNKLWHSVSHPPMPDIGRDRSLWREYCDVRIELDPFIPLSIRDTVDAFLARLPRPLILFHSQGSPPFERRALRGDVAEAVCRRLLTETAGSVVALDWRGQRENDDRRNEKSLVNNPRVISLRRDWKPLDVGEFYWVLKHADLFIGIDSGPAHFLRFTDTPGVVCWTKQRPPFGVPAYCALPRPLTMNIVPRVPQSRDADYRTTYNIIESSDRELLDGDFIAEQALALLNGQGRNLVADGKQRSADVAATLVFDVANGMAYQADRTRSVEYGEAYFDKYVAMRGTEIADRINDARTALTEKYCTRLLDIGIGCGEFIERSRLPALGFDVNPKAVEWLKERGRFFDPFHAGALPHDIDGVTLWDVLEHLPEPDNLLKLVRPRVYVFVSLPIFEEIQKIKESKHFRPDEHYWYFTPAGFVNYMANRGFELVEQNRAETDAGRESIGTFVFAKGSSTQEKSAEAPAASRAAAVLRAAEETVRAVPVNVDKLGGWSKATHFCLPSGIGDISWAYSKLCHLKAITGRELIISCPGDSDPKRGASFVELLPEARWGGYLPDVSNWSTIMQSIPAAWPTIMGTWEPLSQSMIHRASVNLHLEMGNRIETWLPWCPVNHHYALRIPECDSAEADSLVAELGKPIVVIYCSKQNDQLLWGGWNVWSVEEWSALVCQIALIPKCRSASFLFVGAEYDREKTELVAAQVIALGVQAKTVIGRPLGVTIACMQKSHFMISYPSGLGIVANVIRLPCIMLMPWALRKMHDTWGDPIDLANERYKIWVYPTVEEVAFWFERTGMYQVFPWMRS